MENIIRQCKELYSIAFSEDGAFCDMLFSLFSKDLRYITEAKQVVCMAFCIDVFTEDKKGKYIYAVATHPNFRNKGYMSRLFEKIEKEFKKDYFFLCLHPASENLIELYRKKGFALNLCKSITGVAEKPCILITNESQLKEVLKKVLPKNSIEYSENYLKLLLLYTAVYCDSKENPTKLFIEQKNGEVLECFSKQNLKTSCRSMSKPLKDINIDNYYFAVTLE